MTNPDMNITEDLRRFLKSDRDFKLPPRLADDQPLITTGIVDSFSIVKLVVYLEKTYQIRVAPEDLSEKNFNTLQSIELYVRHKLKSKP